MKSLHKIYLIGLGAIGAIYAQRIQQNCPGCLSVVTGGERFYRYTNQGIVINGENVPFRFVLPEEVTETADLILIAVKQHHLSQTIEDIKSLVGPETIILSLLNGISSEEILGEHFGMDKLLHSFVVGTDAVRIDTGIDFSNIGRIVFGDKNGSTDSEKVAAVRAFFDDAKVPYNVPDDILREMWWKFMLNVGANQVSAVLRAPYGVLSVPGDARDLMAEASREVADISVKAGIGLTEEDIGRYINILGTLSPMGKTSMLQDVEAGRKTEVEIFSGTVIELGKKYGVATPVNGMLYKIIKATEQTALFQR